MKTVTVLVSIQMDIQGEDSLSEVIDVLEAINGLTGSIENQPQIFVSDIDKSNINFPDDFSVGDFVEVPDPDDSDIHTHSFVGTIVGFYNGNAVVEDMDNNTFEIEVERLTLIETI